MVQHKMWFSTRLDSGEVVPGPYRNFENYILYTITSLDGFNLIYDFYSAINVTNEVSINCRFTLK